MPQRTHQLTTDDASAIKAMLMRGDHQHNIAAFFSVNGGRIADIATGKTFPWVQRSKGKLPPAGPYDVPRLIAGIEISDARMETTVNEIVDACANLECVLPSDIRIKAAPVLSKLIHCALQLERRC